jgi:hypothetical protein
MIMRVIKWYINTGFAGCKHEGEFEVDNETSDAEIDDMVNDEMQNIIEWGWNDASPSR